MTDKSPRQKPSKKSVQTIKEKRAAKRAKAAPAGEPIIPPTKRR